MSKLKKDVEGSYYMTNEGYNIKILHYKGANDIDVQFEDGCVINTTMGQIRKGRVGNPYHPTLCNIGYLGIGKNNASKDRKATPNYIVWAHMIRRCYDAKLHKRQPTYENCSVYKEWLNFQNFAEWFKTNYIEGFHLDKDILVKGNKVYSSETCVFIPQEINKIFTTSGAQRGNYPIGVTKYKGRFFSRLNIKGSLVFLGAFDTVGEAFQAYKMAKESYIKEIADEWKPQLSPQTYRALISYKIEITD